MGSAEQPHGLAAAGMVVTNAFIWGDVKLEKWRAPGCQRGLGKIFSDVKELARTGEVDDQRSHLFGARPVAGDPWDAHTYLTFLRLQSSFFPQPYHELARALRENGDEADAIRVLIAGEDERYRQYGWAGAILGGFLKRGSSPK